MSPAEEESREQDSWGVRDGAKAQEGGGSQGVRCAEVPGRVRQVPSKREGFLTFIHGVRLFLLSLH